MKKKVLFGKYNFAFDVSQLENYVDQSSEELIIKSLFEGVTGTMFQRKTDIKYKWQLQELDDEVFWQDPSCGTFAPSGDTTFEKKELTVGKIEVEKSWCPEDLENKWTQLLLQRGSTYTDLPIEAQITNLYVGLMNEAVEIALWQSNVATGGSVNLNKFDGFIVALDATDFTGTAVDANTTGGGYTQQTSITDSNIISITDQMVKSLPAGVDQKPDLVMVGGWDVLKKLIVANKNANNFYYNGVVANPYETGKLELPGWGITFQAVHGLDNTERIFLGRKSNFWIGTDADGEWNKFQLWYSMDFDQMRLRIKFKLGTQTGRNNEIVQYTNK